MIGRRTGRTGPWEAPDIYGRGTIEIGVGVEFDAGPVRSHVQCGPGAIVRIGDDAFIGYGAAIASRARIEIGPATHLGPFVSIMDSDFHPVGSETPAPEPQPVTIGRGVTIECGVTILRGAVIGDGARVLAGSVVTGEVGAGAVVAGAPARPWPGEAKLA